MAGVAEDIEEVNIYLFFDILSVGNLAILPVSTSET